MSYTQLSRKERGIIAQLQDMRVEDIAKRLGRSPSTIYRELKRNSEGSRYRCAPAQEKYEQRRKKCMPKGKRQHPELVDYVQTHLSETWSPEQIAERIKLDYPRQKQMRISHSTIYRWLREEWCSQAAALKLNLRHAGHRHGEKRGKFNGVRELKERSRQALRRKRLGDWEVDTIVSSNSRKPECLLSICDRKSRYCGLVLLKRRSAPEVMRGFMFLFGHEEEPGMPLETMTGDRGTEFACYKEVEEIWKKPFYFARPHSPWQKPSVENQNGLIRQFFPKGTNFCEITQDQVAHVMDLLNNRPRKCLNFRTPAEVLHLA